MKHPYTFRWAALLLCAGALRCGSPSSDAGPDAVPDVVFVRDSGSRDVPTDVVGDTRDVAQNDAADEAALPDSAFGRLGGVVRDTRGARLSGFVCTMGGPRIELAFDIEGTPVDVVVSLDSEAPWLQRVRPRLPDQCATTLTSFEGVVGEGLHGEVHAFVLTESGRTRLRPAFDAPMWPPFSLEGVVLVNHDAYAHSTRPHSVPAANESTPGAATSPVDLAPETLERLLGAEWAATAAAGGAQVLSFMYGQTPIVFGPANPLDLHVSYWRDRGCGANCRRDNFARLLDSGRDLVDVLAAQSRGLRMLSMRLNDYHHVLAPGFTGIMTTRHPVANPPFLEGHYISPCHTSLLDEDTLDWKLAQIRDIFARFESEAVELDGFELDLTRGFCFGAEQSDDVSGPIGTIVRALAVALGDSPLIVRLPRDRSLTEVEGHVGTLLSMQEGGVDAWVLGRTVGARNDPVNDEVSMLLAVRSLGQPFWLDSFQYDRSVRTRTRSRNLPATFERLISDAASAYGRGAVGASLFNFQYYAQHFARPVGSRFERVAPPYEWLECLRRPSCVASVPRHYAGRLDGGRRWLVDYRPSSPTPGVAWITIHPRGDADLGDFQAGFIEVVNTRTDDAYIFQADSRPYPFADDLGLAGGLYGPLLYSDPNARSAVVSPPPVGLSRFEFRCDETAVCNAIDTVELFVTSQTYVVE